MRPFQIQPDLQRAQIDGFRWPLGIVPDSVATRPREGYVVGYNPAQDEEPDTYSFRIVASQEKLASLVERAFELLPARVGGIVEIGSRDAYRSVDTFLSQDHIDREVFLDSWRHFESLLLEDMTIAAGANAEEPYVEVFLDQFKTLSIHVPISHRDQVDAMLHEEGFEELDTLDGPPGESIEFRPILHLIDEYSPDLDELLLGLRELWQLELEVDPDRNIDEGGRELGATLWNIVAIVSRDKIADQHASEENQPDHVSEDVGQEGAYAIFWLTARSLNEAEQLVIASLDETDWELEEFYTTDRVAFDERPDELADLPPLFSDPKMHLLYFDPWDQADEPSTVEHDDAL